MVAHLFDPRTVTSMLVAPRNSTTSSWHPLPKGALDAQVWKGSSGDKIEVALAEFAAPPTAPELADLWAKRQAKTPVALLLVWLSPAGAHLAFGSAGDAKPHSTGAVSTDAALAVARLALGASDHLRAAGDVVDAIAELNARIPGLTNGGLLALHHLATGVRQRPDWSSAAASAKPLLSKRGKDLLRGLGYKITGRVDADVLLLAAPDGDPRATAVLIDIGSGEKELLDLAYRAAVDSSVQWIIALDRHQLRIYPARADVGVAGRGPLETFVEVNTALLGPDDYSYLWLLFSHEALAPGGSLTEILEESGRFAVDLGRRLRERIYHHTVSHLVDAIVAARKARKKPVAAGDLTDVYHQALTYLFRLLFLAYAEDRDLLPVKTNAAYQAASLTAIADQLHKGALPVNLNTYLTELFGAVDRGRSEWGVPAYNGGLFSTNPSKNPAGAALAKLELPDDQLRLALKGLLIDSDGDEPGPVDFRSLRVREFGTIYEGLLEAELSLAVSDLTATAAGELEPTPAGATPTVRKGQVYLHNKSGARKAAGAYFTPAFAVDHLLDHSLEPALAEHCEQVRTLANQGRTTEAGELFFSFRAADLAMGSGHFLVAATDRVAARLAVLHAELRLPSVAQQLDQLRAASDQAMQQPQRLTDLSLIRRVVARRCIYGVDINPMSAELTRLSLWIHTFIPGLPMSYLGHNLRSGNSLTGIGTMAELEQLLADPPRAGRGRRTPVGPSLFSGEVADPLDQVRSALLGAVAATDATVAEIHQIEAELDKLEKQTAPAKALCDILVMLRAKRTTMPVDWSASLDEIIVSHGQAGAAFAREVDALHFPVVWPEVFTGGDPGFQVCLGNPPWEKLHIEEHAFWARYRPGLRGRDVSTEERDATIAQMSAARPDLVAQLAREKSAAESARQVVMAGPYPGLGSAHPDLYQAFCWRNWQSVTSTGRIGMVVPRGALAGSGAMAWRTEIYEHGEFTDVVVLVNNKSWVFGIHPQFTVALVSLRKGAAGSVYLRGPFRSLEELTVGAAKPAVPVPASEFRKFASGGAFPQLPSSDAAAVYRQMRLAPRFDDPSHSWKCAPVQGDLNATTHKPYFVPRSSTSLPVWAGKNFNRWQPDTGADPYAWADPEGAGRFIQGRDERRAEAVANGGRRARTQTQDGQLALSVVSEPQDTPEAPAAVSNPGVRLAFRCIARATDRRTVIAAAIPGDRYLQHSAGFLRFSIGGAVEEAAVLGVLCSTSLDWFARRLVETGLTFEILNSFPMPRLGEHLARIAQIAGLRTARADKRLEDWARSAGADLTESTINADLDVELDARVADAYGLTPDHLSTIWSTYGPGADELPDLAAVTVRLQQFQVQRTQP